jgi:hypothetical protein
MEGKHDGGEKQDAENAKIKTEMATRQNPAKLGVFWHISFKSQVNKTAHLPKQQGNGHTLKQVGHDYNANDQGKRIKITVTH